MHAGERPEAIDHSRRRLVSAAALVITAAEFGILDTAKAQSVTTTTPSRTSFGPLKQIDAGTLNVGYAEAGPADGPVVVLLHGWPYDIYSYVDVAPLLASVGYRVIVPYLRGYGTTHFRSAVTPRNPVSRRSLRSTSSH